MNYSDYLYQFVINGLKAEKGKMNYICEKYEIDNPEVIKGSNCAVGLQVVNQHKDFGIGTIIAINSNLTCSVKYENSVKHQMIGNGGQYDLIKYIEHGKKGIKVQRNPIYVRKGNRRGGNSVQSRTGRVICKVSNFRNKKRTLKIKEEIKQGFKR